MKSVAPGNSVCKAWLPAPTPASEVLRRSRRTRRSGWGPRKAAPPRSTKPWWAPSGNAPENSRTTENAIGCVRRPLLRNSGLPGTMELFGGARIAREGLRKCLSPPGESGESCLAQPLWTSCPSQSLPPPRALGPQQPRKLGIDIAPCRPNQAWLNPAPGEPCFGQMDLHTWIESNRRVKQRPTKVQ